MALIICPECGKQISNKAKACVHCGNPLSALSGNLILCGKPAFNKPIYYFYDANGNLFDSVLGGEKKYYQIDKPITLILGHKRGSFAGSAVKDSQPVHIDPNKVTCYEASVFSRFLACEYRLTPVEM